jgi:hypothetical protein
VIVDVHLTFEVNEHGEWLDLASQIGGLGPLTFDAEGHEEFVEQIDREHREAA